MNGLFKVTNVFRTQIEGRTPQEGKRAKVEITLCYHESYFSSQMGQAVRRQYRQVSLLDDSANNWNVPVGSWIVACISDVAYKSQNTPGRVNVCTYLDHFIVVSSMEDL